MKNVLKIGAMMVALTFGLASCEKEESLVQNSQEVEQKKSSPETQKDGITYYSTENEMNESLEVLLTDSEPKDFFDMVFIEDLGYGHTKIQSNGTNTNDDNDRIICFGKMVHVLPCASAYAVFSPCPIRVYSVMVEGVTVWFADQPC